MATRQETYEEVRRLACGRKGYSEPLYDRCHDLFETWLLLPENYFLVADMADEDPKVRRRAEKEARKLCGAWVKERYREQACNTAPGALPAILGWFAWQALSGLISFLVQEFLRSRFRGTSAGMAPP